MELNGFSNLALSVVSVGEDHNCCDAFRPVPMQKIATYADDYSTEAFVFGKLQIFLSIYAIINTTM